MLLLHKPISLALLLLGVFCGASLTAQISVEFPEHLKDTRMYRLKVQDTIVYYQCRVADVEQKTKTDQGVEIVSRQKITITEKYHITRLAEGYRLRYSVSSFTNYPNKKFAYLKLRERAKDGWGFQLKNESLLSDKDVLVIAALETKTHDITHYELKVNISSPNELLILHDAQAEQLIIEGNYILSTSLSCLR